MVKKGLDKKFLIALSLILIASVIIAVALGADSGIGVTLNTSMSSASTMLYNGTFSEDTIFPVNISINNTVATAISGSNVTEFNVTLPAGFTFVANTNLSSSALAGLIGNSNFTNTSSVLKWLNTTADGAVATCTAVSNISSFISFNITATNPGVYNMTLRWRNGTTAQTENITILVNDTTAPQTSWASQTYGNYSNNSKFGIVANISVNDNWDSDASIVNGVLANATINITLMNSAYDPINSTTTIYFILNTTSLYINFTSSTGLTEAVYYINASINDSTGNLNSTLRKITLDRTAPVNITLTCTPNVDINEAESVTCTCVAADALVGVQTTTYNTTATTNSVGSHTEYCTAVDYAGNSASATWTYTVYSSGAAASSSGGGGSITTWTKTIILPDSDFEKGTTQELGSNQRVQVLVNGTKHNIGVKFVTTDKITLEVSSTPQTADLSVGEVKKFDVNDDGVYDLSVTLNKIVSGKAELTMLAINEQIPAGSTTTEEETTSSQDTATTTGAEATGFSWSTIIWIIVLLVIIIGVWILLKKRR